MAVFKLYDACCDRCNDWYGSSFRHPDSTNKKEAIEEMKASGWRITSKETVCHSCIEKERELDRKLDIKEVTTGRNLNEIHVVSKREKQC